MNRKIFIGLIVLLLIGLAVWLLWPRTPAPIVEIKSKTVQPPAAVQSVSTNQGIQVPTAEEQAQTHEQKQARYLKKAQEASKDLNRPMSFYGQVLDQSNQPVANVKIEGHRSYFNEILPGPWPEQEKLSFTSDAQGRFQFDGSARGLGLQFDSLTKEGYEFKNGGFLSIGFQVGSPVYSTPDKPYIFHAFKKVKTEPLIKDAVSIHEAKPDGRWYDLDLLKDKITEGTSGDLKFSLTREPGTMGHTDRDWSMEIQGVDAEFVEASASDAFMYQAPESGYQSSWRYEAKAGQPGYNRRIKRKFYVRKRNGSMYASMEIEIMADGREGSYSVYTQYVINPAGSPNLEFDEKKQIDVERIKEVGLEKAIEEAKSGSKP